MPQKKRKMEVFHSVEEFEKKYFPRAFAKRMQEKSVTAAVLGMTLAKESLDKIRTGLAK